MNKLEKCFDVEYKMYHGDIEKSIYDYLFNQLKLMIVKRFAQRKQTHEYIHRWNFYVESVYPMILAKKACLFVIYSDKKPIAISLNYLQQNIFVSAVDSYDIDYSKFGLGNILIQKKLQWCINNAFTIVNMGYGDLKYKRDWCNTIYNFKTQVIYNRHSLSQKLISKLLKKLVKLKMNFNEKIKKKLQQKIDLLKSFLSKKRKPIQNKIRKISNETLTDLMYNEKVFKIDTDSQKYFFLRKYIFDFQYVNTENSKDLELFKYYCFNLKKYFYIIKGKNVNAMLDV